MVKPARVAGERVGTRESVGRRQNKNPGELYHRGFCFRTISRARPKAEENRAVGNRETDGQVREGSG